jgi:hypothetical protein
MHHLPVSSSKGPMAQSITDGCYGCLPSMDPTGRYAVSPMLPVLGPHLGESSMH